MTPREVDLGPGGGGYGADVATYPMPGKEGLAGALLAIDVRTMEVRWKVEQPALFLSGALSTDGGLLFIGDLDRHFQAFDTETGKQLWSTRCQHRPTATPLPMRLRENSSSRFLRGSGYSGR